MSSNVKITVIGCGVVGACIAYELSALKHLEITVVEARSQAGLGCSSAALGICMGVISHKTKGRNWRLRAESLKRYDDLIVELGATDDRSMPSGVPFNRQGIVKLCGVEEAWESWQFLQQKRQQQGYNLDLWPLSQVQKYFPALNYSTFQGAIYSPHDRQVDPLKLTQSLVAHLQHQGVRFLFNTSVQGLLRGNEGIRAVQVQRQSLSEIALSETNELETDYVILTAGVGNTGISHTLSTGNTHRAVPQFQPVLGQAWQVQLSESLWAGSTDEKGLHPIVTGRDLHFVPLEVPRGAAPQYWVGATVEFPADQDPSDPTPSETIAAELWQQALDMCPPLAHSTIQRHWWGLRPRPTNQAAPVLQWSDTAANLLWATGHYRNGVFLAPATALWVKDQLLQKL